MSVGDRDLAAAHALGALPPGEEARLEEDLVQNSLLASEVEKYRGVVDALESGMARDVSAHRAVRRRSRPNRRRAHRRADCAFHRTCADPGPTRRSRFGSGRADGSFPRSRPALQWLPRSLRSSLQSPPVPASGHRTRARPCVGRRSSPRSTVTPGSMRRAGKTGGSSSTSPMCRRLRQRTSTTRCGFSAGAARERWRPSARSRPTAPTCGSSSGSPAPVTTRPSTSRSSPTAAPRATRAEPRRRTLRARVVSRDDVPEAHQDDQVAQLR